MPRRSNLECLLETFGLTEEYFQVYKRLFLETRSRYCPSFYPAWTPDEEPAFCIGCQDILIETAKTNGDGKRRLIAHCDECGKWMKATRRSEADRFAWWSRDYRWTVPTWSVRKERDVIATDSLIARHLSWDLTKNFRLVSLRARDSKFLEWDQVQAGSSLVILDLDFKRLWTPDEIERFDVAIQRDLGSLRVEAILDDYQKTYTKFIEETKKIIGELPVVPLVFRSSWSHGIHVYVFLDRLSPSSEINERVRGFLHKRELLASPILDANVHPHATAALRLPLGYGSKLLDPRSLEPLFEGDDVSSQVPPALRWLRENESALPRASLAAFGSTTAPAPTKEKKPFDPVVPLRAWEEGIVSPGTRRHRTKSVILLGRYLGFYGVELEAFVNNWLLSKHNGQSRDVNRFKRYDPELLRLRAENKSLVAAVGRRQRKAPDVPAPIPLRVFQEIVARVTKLDVDAPEGFKIIKFAFEMYSLADYLTWLSGSDPRTLIAISKKLWRRLHERYDGLRWHCQRAGLVEQASKAEFNCYARGSGKAATWIFPLLGDVNKSEPRVYLHEGLASVWSPKDQREHLTDYYLRLVRSKAKEEAAEPRWGSGDLAAQAARKLRTQIESGGENGGAKSRPLRSREEANAEDKIACLG
jgi:hypothetical protein